MLDDPFYEELSRLVNSAFDDAFGRKTPTKLPIKHLKQQKEIRTNQMIEENEVNLEPVVYDSIEDYKAKTGKRFRMTKEQKSRLVKGKVATQEEKNAAFNETYGV